MPILRVGFTIWTLGSGLKLLFNQNTHIAVYIAVLAVEGAGIGWVHQPGESSTITHQYFLSKAVNLHPGLVALQANSANEDRAVATGTRNVFRSLGGVVGIAVSTAVYYAVLQKALQQNNNIPEWLRDSVLDGTWSANNPATKDYESAILSARMQGFRVIFIITVPLMASCLGASFLVDDVILKGDITHQERREEHGEGQEQATNGGSTSNKKRG